MDWFEPDRYLSSLASIDIKHDLLGRGLTHVLLDIDNTIRSREDGQIPPAIKMWLAKAKAAGIEFCLISNNWHSDVYGFAQELKMPIVAKACKPLPFAYGPAMKAIGATKEDTVAIGDQLVTDVVGAHVVGIPAWLVQPLCEVDVKSTAISRAIERAMMGARQPEPQPEGAIFADALVGQGLAPAASEASSTERKAVP